MIFDSGKSADPTTTDFKSPEALPPPSGLELPHAAAVVTRASVVAATNSFRTRHFSVVICPTLSGRARPRRALTHGEPRPKCLLLCRKQQGWPYEQRSVCATQVRRAAASPTTASGPGGASEGPGGVQTGQGGVQTAG